MISVRIDEEDAKDLKAFLARKGMSLQDFLLNHINAFLSEERAKEK